MSQSISVIICTHNPREDYLRRVLKALDLQTLCKDLWELLLIDNASAESLSEKYDLSWHPNARHVREEELGLTPTRIRGIRETCADILVFVDDDNVLAPDYLDQAFKIAHERSWVGAFCGNIEPEFECEPEPGLGNLVDWVGVVRVKEEKWALGTAAIAQQYCPIGAGMVIRRCVAVHYAELLKSNPIRKKLDRRGTALLCHGDTDMALSACDLGMAVGRFPTLQIIHLIPARRTKEEYIFRLIEDAAFSDGLFMYIREGKVPNLPAQTTPCRSEKILQNYKDLRNKIHRRKEIKTNEQKFDEVWQRGTRRAYSEIMLMEAEGRYKNKSK
jgi:glycosyltransferase involved in cell wall biosynthesis